MPRKLRRGARAGCRRQCHEPQCEREIFSAGIRHRSPPWKLGRHGTRSPFAGPVQSCPCRGQREGDEAASPDISAETSRLNSVFNCATQLNLLRSGFGEETFRKLTIVKADQCGTGAKCFSIAIDLE